MFKRGFTLIELLIVVAIIAILAAIAVPNFLEAQTRSKIARVKADIRAIGTGLEAYAVDQNRYPQGREQGQGDSLYSLWRLSTPVAYMTAVNIKDPFTNTDKYMGNGRTAFNYFCYASYSPWATTAYNSQFAVLGYRAGWCVSSYGPDKLSDACEWYPIFLLTDKPAAMRKLYDPTNGTISTGDLPRYGGDLPVPAIP